MKSRSGFTIVELLIVIVVIGILAAIVIVAYNGIQDRAKDAQMRSGIGQLEKAMQLWNVKYGEAPIGGHGSTAAISGHNCADGLNGWLASGIYSCTLEDALHATGYLPEDFIANLPSNSIVYVNSSGDRSVMFYRCGGGTSNRFALYYHLRNPTAAETQQLANIEASGCTSGPRTSYGMTAAKIIQF